MTDVEISAPWTSDDLRARCTSCQQKFQDVINRRHHCRLCGDIFCEKCTQQRALIPARSIVLKPKGGKKVSFKDKVIQRVSLQTDADPGRRVTVLKNAPNSEIRDGQVQMMPAGNAATFNRSVLEQHEIYYDTTLEDDLLSLSIESSTGLSYSTESDRNVGNTMPKGGLALPANAERIKLSAEPLRVCQMCYNQLDHLQVELRNSNSNAMKYNSIDPTHIQRLLNSPVAFTLGFEIRKAAYTLNNLLPLPKRMSSFVPIYENGEMRMIDAELCADMCKGVGGNLSNMDGVRIPATLLERAKGVVVMTVVKIGMGVAGFEFGTGLVISRLKPERWSAPCAIGSVSASVGSMAGIQVSDHVFLLMTDEAVDIMSSNDASIQLGADVGIALGPLGRAAETDLAIGKNMRSSTTNGQRSNVSLAPIYSYSQSKGFYAGISLVGKVVATRHEVNEKFYGQKVEARQLLTGMIPQPPAAQPLYDALKRCHVYAGQSAMGGTPNTL
jgi:lipid-binding SYLF domain-containing protein